MLRLIPRTEAATYVDTLTDPADRPMKRSAFAHLGRGVLRPFRRDEKNDFANAEGADLVRACVGQLLAMEASSENVRGELEWDPARGSQLYKLRHANNDAVLREMAKFYVTDALRRFEPRVRLTAIGVSGTYGPDGSLSVLLIRVKYDLLSSNNAANQVVLSGVKQTISIPFQQAA